MSRQHTLPSIVMRLVIPALLSIIPLMLIASGGQPAQAGVSAGNSSGSSQGARQQSVVLRVYFNSHAERDRLATELAAEETDTTVGYLVVWTDWLTYQDLLTRGLRVEIDQKATEEVNNPILFGNTFYGGYYTVEEMEEFLDDMVAEYPTLAQKVDIGDSWCKTHPGQCPQPTPGFNGYDLWVLRITNQAIPGPKPVFWYDAGIHSREIATPEVAMQYINWLLSNYDTNADARWLVDHHDIWVMPMFNPDGHHIVEAGGGGTNPYTHRKNADRDDGCTTWPPNASSQFGVDLNRNFPFLWGCCGGSSTAPCNLSYRGPSEASEEEVQFMVTKVRELIPDQRGPGNNDPAPITTTGVLINMHSNAQLNIYAWGWTNQHAPNRDEMFNIGARMGASPTYGGNGYRSCQSTECLYIVDGDEKNWAYGELGIPGYSLEVHGNGFFPTHQYTLNDIWPRNRGALVYAAKIARTPYINTRGPDALTDAGTPILVSQGATAHLTATINYNWSYPPYNNNLYLQNVAAAEYYIDTPPWAGGAPTPMSPVDGSYNSPTEAVEAMVDTTGLPPGRHVIFIRGRGVNSYQGHESWGPIGAVFLDVEPGNVTPTVTVPPATETPVPPSFTPVPPSVTMTPIPPSLTPVPPTNTAVPTHTAVTTATSVPTSEPCTIRFSDVDESSPFFEGIMCLACRGIVSGYEDGTFKPGNQVTRGQLAKIVSNAAGYTENPHPQMFQDVPPSNPFYEWINRLARRGHMGGYDCGGPGEPCVTGMPYFRPFADATRGQTSKIVANAANINDPVSGQTFEDVPIDHPFYAWMERLASRGVMGGYECGGPGEPCQPGNRAYFRPYNNVTRGQSAKIVANTFYPGCEAGR